MNGIFVVLEGIDGSGSTTQVRAIARRLESMWVPTLATREPSDNPVGAHIRRLLSREVKGHPCDAYTMASLFAADRLNHLAMDILPAIRDGRVVICDRYVLSSLAYQGTLLGSTEWVSEINKHAINPDIEFFLSLEVEEASRRRSGRYFEQIYEVDEFLLRVMEAYRTLATQRGSVVVDASLPPTEITEIILDKILHCLGSRESTR